MEKENKKPSFASGDDEWVMQIQSGADDRIDELMHKYLSLIRREANALYLLGADNEDLMQEGLIGLAKAVRTFCPERGSFYPYAKMCILRSMYTAIEAASRKKHMPLNSYVSIFAERNEEDSPLLERMQEQTENNPEVLWVERENAQDLMRSIETVLSRLERQVFHLALEGLSSRQIAERLDRTEKSVDNAMQRIRRKTQKILDMGA